MYFHERSATVNTVPLYMLLLLFPITHSDNASFYFSLHENRAIKGAPFILNAHTEDVMLCARACVAQLNCNTANYVAAEKKCDLSQERMENVSNGAAIVILRGCYLIEKVEIDPVSQVIKHPTNSITWLHFTPQWCTSQGRGSFSGNKKTTADECKEKCKDGCLGVEWWENSRSCYECTDPSKKTAYKYTDDIGYPPHVFLKSNS